MKITFQNWIKSFCITVSQIYKMISNYFVYILPFKSKIDCQEGK